MATSLSRTAAHYSMGMYHGKLFLGATLIEGGALLGIKYLKEAPEMSDQKKTAIRITRYFLVAVVFVGFFVSTLSSTLAAFSFFSYTTGIQSGATHRLALQAIGSATLLASLVTHITAIILAFHE